MSESRRRLIFLIALVAGVVSFAVLASVVIRGNFSKPLSSYLNNLRAGYIPDAYQALCTDTKREKSMEQFSAAFDAQRREIGTITKFRALRGDDEFGSTVITGERKTVLAHTPMKKEGGDWRPCPKEGPLGELLPPP